MEQVGTSRGSLLIASQDMTAPADPQEWFVLRTLRSAAVVTVFVLVMLSSYGQFWALVPVSVGATLGMALLAAMNLFVRRTFTPEKAARAAEKKKWHNGTKGAMVAFALIKYLLVGVLIYAITHAWNLREVMAFTGGYVLIHLIIGLRAIGRILFVPAA